MSSLSSFWDGGEDGVVAGVLKFSSSGVAETHKTDLGIMVGELHAGEEVRVCTNRVVLGAKASDFHVKSAIAPTASSIEEEGRIINIFNSNLEIQ